MKSPIAIALAALIAGGCTATQKSQEPQPGVALFDTFRYEGNDSIYAIYPLADSASFHNPILPGWYSDPSVCTNGEGDYFLVTSTFCYYPEFPSSIAPTW